MFERSSLGRVQRMGHVAGGFPSLRGICSSRVGHRLGIVVPSLGDPNPDPGWHGSTEGIKSLGQPRGGVVIALAWERPDQWSRVVGKQ